MAEVSVNIRGRDDGLGSQLDSLRQKAQELGRDISEVNNLSDLTPTQQKNAINNLGEDTLREQKGQIREEYSDLRSITETNFEEVQEKYASGEISKETFGKYEDEFKSDQKSLDSDESSELLAVEKEMNQTLRDIHKELSDASKIERELKQRDNSEHSGPQAEILRENRELRNLQNKAGSEEEVAAIQERLDENNQRLREMKRPDQEEEGTDMSGIDFRSPLMAAGSAGRGDLMGTVQGGLQAGGSLTGMAKGFTIAGIIAMIVKETLGHGDKLREGLAPVAAMRGGAMTGEMSNDQFREGFNDRFDIGAMGMNNQDFSASMYQKAQASGNAGDDLQARTYADVAFQKAFGGDSGMFSQFERFVEGQESSTEIALDVLNVLTSIDKSSLKENDLSTLTEKLTAQNTILSLQRSKRDVVDNDGALQMLAAFESAGLSGKGERASGFINQTIQGLGEGGSDNLQMWKIEAARRANPEIADDPAALRRKVRFNPDDPEYMSEMFKMIQERTGGNKMAMDDVWYSMFNPESEKDMEIYENMAKGGDPDELLRGKGIEEMKTRKSTLDGDTMVNDANSGVGAVSEAINDFSNRSQSFVDIFSSIFKDIITGNAVNVSILEDKTAPPKNRNTNIPGNNSRTGQ